jgi:hypothetical protein
MRSPRRTLAVPFALALPFTALLAGCGDDAEPVAAPSTTTSTTSLDDAVEEVEEAFDELGEQASGVECLLPDSTVAELAGDDVTTSGFSAGGVGGFGGAGGETEYRLEYRGCSYELAGGGDVVVGEAVDRREGSVADDVAILQGLVGEDEDAEALPELGDGAVRVEDMVLVPVGDRFLFVSSDRNDSAADAELAVAVAAAVLEG